MRVELITGTASRPDDRVALTLVGTDDGPYTFLVDGVTVAEFASICSCHSPRPIDKLMFAAKNCGPESDRMRLYLPTGLRG